MLNAARSVLMPLFSSSAHKADATASAAEAASAAASAAAPLKPCTAQAMIISLAICSSGALMYWAQGHNSPEVTTLDLGAGTISLELSQFSNQADSAPVDVGTEIAPEPEPEPIPEPEPKPIPEPEAEPTPEPEPEVVPEPTPAPAPVVKPEKKKQVEPERVHHRREHHEPREHHKPHYRERDHAREQHPPHETAAKAAAAQNAKPTQQRGASAQLMIYGRDQHPVLSKIKSAIDAHLMYPRKARMMRTEGTAVVQFVYTDTRKIKRLRLLKSTGHKELDRAALRSIMVASADFPAVDRSFTLRLPITFEIR